MIQNIDSSTQRFLDNMAQMSDRMQQLEGQIATGKRLVHASDAPDSVSELLTVRASLARLDQTTTNLSQLKTETDTGEQSLETAVQLFERLRTLAMTGAGTAQTASNRKMMADEVSGIMDQLVGIANTQAGGRYIFSGDSDQTQAYTLDWAQVPPVSAYAGSVSTRQVLDPSGVPFATSKTAQEIFDSSEPTKNAFQAITTLHDALMANDDAAIQAALAPLTSVGEHLNSMLGFFGNAQNQVQNASNNLSKIKLQLQTELSGVQDADIVASTVELQQLKIQQQAALQVRASMPKTSLFDFLK